MTEVSMAMQRYAAEIYRLEQDVPMVTLSLLAERMDASLQATSRMIQRLREADLLVHEPYRGVRLTADGERLAAFPAIRRHRLIEVFLVRVMGYDWGETHALADQFERGINDELEHRMDAMTGHPTRCPHGEPIPSRDGTMPPLSDMVLTALEVGKRSRVSRVRTREGDVLRYLAELGLVPGADFTLVNVLPLKGPLRLRLGTREHIIGHELAQTLWVERKDA